MSDGFTDLSDFGWSDFFAEQLEPLELTSHVPAKVAEVHRATIRVLGPSLDSVVPPYYAENGDGEARAIVGDWLLLDKTTREPKRLLTRKSLLKRLAPGKGRKAQLIAANIDTLFIVSSCNQDFSIARIERYLALAHEAGVHPVVVLTKIDQAETPDEYIRQTRDLGNDLVVIGVNAKSDDAAAQLMPWCSKGQTTAFLGSSGVGKSTLVNALTGTDKAQTQSVREDDDKGRHTTTSRELHLLSTGGLLLDTPGMRELQLTDVQAGVEEVFADIAALALTCKFRDCKHETEPGCAIRSALETGEIDNARLQRWKKLSAEDEHNSASLARRRARDKSFGKLVKRVKKSNKKST